MRWFSYLCQLFPFLFLSCIVGDAPPVLGGGSPAAADDPEGGAEPDQNSEAPETPRAPSVSERVAAILKTRSGLQAANNDLGSQLAQLQSQNKTLTENLSAAEARATAAEARVEEYETELARLESEARTVSQGVTDELAQMGIPEAQLPEESSQGDDPAETIEQLYAKLDRTDDPLEAGRLVQKINKLEAE